MTIPSFQIDHTTMDVGVYISRTDRVGDEKVITYDLRFCKPNKGHFTPEAAHSLEHLLAVWFRNASGIEKDVIYIGPMGCLTGFYLILRGERDAECIKSMLVNAMAWVLKQDIVNGATKTECGNYKMHSLAGAKQIARDFLKDALEGSILVVANAKEVDLARRILLFIPNSIVITGVGATNVIQALQDIPRDSPIFNIGFAGSPDMVIGSVVKIGKSRLMHKVDYKEQVYDLGEGPTCYTSTDFVSEGVKPGCVYDMELAIICAMGFKNITSIKVISDNCDYSQYEDTIKEKN